MTALAEEGATLIMTVDCGTAAGPAIEAANAARRRRDRGRSSSGRRDAAACLRRAQSEPAGRSLRPGPFGCGRRRVPLPRGGDARAPPRRRLCRRRRARSPRPARSRCARHRVRRGAAERREPRARRQGAARSCGSRHNAGLRALADVARIDAAPTCYTLGYHPRAAHQCRRQGGGLRASAPSCSPPTTRARRASSRQSSKRSTPSGRRSRSACSPKPSHLAERTLETGRPFIWLAAEGWHKGLLGLVAGRVAERFALPTFVTAWEPDGEGTGSARSIASVDLGRVVRDAVQDGTPDQGRRPCHGCRLQARPSQGRRCARPCSASGSPFPSRPPTASRPLAIDGALSSGAANVELMELLERAGPYGAGHPEPRFVFPAHRLSRVRIINDEHVRCTLIAAGRTRASKRQPSASATRRSPSSCGTARGGRCILPAISAATTWNGRDGVELIVEDAAEATQITLACPRPQSFLYDRRGLHA